MKELNNKETELVCGGFYNNLFSWAEKALTNLTSLISNIISFVPKFNLW